MFKQTSIPGLGSEKQEQRNEDGVKWEWNIVLIGDMDFVLNTTDYIVAGTVPPT